VRGKGGGESLEWETNLQEIAARQRPDLLLERNDHVVVPFTTGRKVMYFVYETVTTIVRITIGGAVAIF
jgi:hypothetical protein